MSPQEVILNCLKEGIVMASKCGEVRSLRWNKPLGCLSRRGYMVCTLHYLQTRKQVKIHQIVWIAFNGPIPEGFLIDHINRAKTDNSLKNLRLATQQKNSSNRRSYAGTNNPAAKMSQEKANKVRVLHSEGVKVKDIADEFKVSKTTIRNIIRGDLWLSNRPMSF